MQRKVVNVRVASLLILAVCLGLSTHAASGQPVPPSPLMPPVRTVSVYGQKIAYYDLSDGPVLVLLHGAGTSATIDWGQVVRKLAEHYRVIAPDQIGFGQSDKPSIAYSFQTYVDFLGEFLRQLGITHFVLAGESLGGGTASLYATEASDPTSNLPKVDKLILSDAALPNQLKRITIPSAPSASSTAPRPMGLLPPTLEDYRKGLEAALFYNKSYATEAYARDVYTLLISYHTGATFQGMAGPNPAASYLDEHLKDIKIPTLVIWGQQDALIPLSVGEYAHATIAQSKFVIVPECGHAPAIEKPEQFLKAAFEFLGN